MYFIAQRQAVSRFISAQNNLAHRGIIAIVQVGSAHFSLPCRAQAVIVGTFSGRRVAPPLLLQCCSSVLRSSSAHTDVLLSLSVTLYKRSKYTTAPQFYSTQHTIYSSSNPLLMTRSRTRGGGDDTRITLLDREKSDTAASSAPPLLAGCRDGQRIYRCKDSRHHGRGSYGGMPRMQPPSQPTAMEEEPQVSAPSQACTNSGVHQVRRAPSKATPKRDFTT